MGLTDQLDSLGDKWYTKAFVTICVFAVVVFVGVGINDGWPEEYNRQVNECHSIYGEENLTFEVVEDGCYMAYINETLVYAGGQVVDEEHPYTYTHPGMYLLSAVLMAVGSIFIYKHFVYDK